MRIVLASCRLFLALRIGINMTIRIGTDVDEVKAELLSSACKFWNTNYLEVFARKSPNGIQPYHFDKYDLSSVMGWPTGEDQEYHRAFARSQDYHSIQPVKGSVEAVAHLAGRYELHAVTLRRATT